MINAFLTGSHVYGTPHPGSDVDLCVLMSPEDANEFKRLNPGPAWPPSSGGNEQECVSVKRGGVDFIICTTEAQFNLWRIARDILVRHRPVDKTRCIIVHNVVRGVKVVDALDVFCAG